MILCVLPVFSFYITFKKKNKKKTCHFKALTTICASLVDISITDCNVSTNRRTRIMTAVVLLPQLPRLCAIVSEWTKAYDVPFQYCDRRIVTSRRTLYVCDQTANNGICADSAHLLVSNCTHATGWTMALKQVCQAFLLCFSVKCVVLWWVL